MEPGGHGDFAIVSYRPHHRAAVRRICVATAWMGEPAPDRIADDWIWAEFWTRYFTDREPRHTWVVEDIRHRQAVGYLMGTADAAQVERYAAFLVPGILYRVCRRRLLRRAAPRRALLAMARSLLSGELDVPARVRRRYPGTLHIDLLPQARGRGFASRLFRLYIDRMRQLGVPGVHAQSLGANEAIAAFNRRAGFRLIDTRPIHALAGVDARPVTISTWVLPL
ncbi:MAG TPA: GNAT family N-acetyltransferase [Phycisphaerae bacterium]|nr:GNAT family N-acetyltransferase [Phycisphaerae bacterium]